MYVEFSEDGKIIESVRGGSHELFRFDKLNILRKEGALQFNGRNLLRYFR